MGEQWVADPNPPQTIDQQKYEDKIKNTAANITFVIVGRHADVAMLILLLPCRCLALFSCAFYTEF